jgi:hypothetical protein
MLSLVLTLEELVKVYLRIARSYLWEVRLLAM